MGVNGLASGCVMFLSIVRFFSRGGGLKKKQKNHFVIFKCFFFFLSLKHLLKLKVR